MARLVDGDCSEHCGNRPPLATVKRIFGVAPDAAQRTPGKAHEDGAPADSVGFALQRVEDFTDAQPLFGFCRSSGIHDIAVRYASGSMTVHGKTQRRGSVFSARKRPCASRATVVSGYECTTWFNVASA